MVSLGTLALLFSVAYKMDPTMLSSALYFEATTFFNLLTKKLYSPDYRKNLNIIEIIEAVLAASEVEVSKSP